MPTLDATSEALSLRSRIDELNAARGESERLFSILKPQAWYERPIAERHRVIFYLGHLDAFDSIQICREAQGIPSPDSALDTLFQAGIDPDSKHLPTDTPGDWPTLDKVRAYVELCRAHVDAHLATAPEHAFSMALEHRLMHLETLAYMFHNFDFGSKECACVKECEANDTVPQNDWCSIPAGEAVLGKPDNGHFGWDNEYPETRRFVPAFRIQQHNVTNGDYLRFVEQGAKVPNFWVQRGGCYCYRGMFGEFPLPLDWPVYVSQQEAVAYAKWQGKSLPTEEQFHRAAYASPTGITCAYPWGDAAPDRRYGNFDFKRWDPESVMATPEGNSAFGVSQLVGNGWEWTSTLFAPFPGFRPQESYPGYSANFFDGHHYVLKGGSPRTAARLLRPSFRNWFRPDYRYVYATFRCVENE